MSFGRPPSFMQFSAAPPDRGSFPLDHEGECSAFMQAYLTCLKENQHNNGKCRDFSMAYLECRMNKGLMGRDSFDNLGYRDLTKESESQGRGNMPRTDSTEAQSSAEMNSSHKDDAPSSKPSPPSSAQSSA